MSPSLRSVDAITLFVEDPQRSKAFYKKIFELSPVHEDDDSVAFKLGGTIVNLLQTAAARELVEPAPVAGRPSGARFQLTVSVDDADAVCAELARRGVELLNGPIDREWGLRTASFADPDGHIWEVAQAIDQGGAPPAPPGRVAG